MTTALTTTNQQLPARTHLGDRNEIAAIHSRLATMMQLPADVPADVIWAAAQIAAAHHLDPFVGELYIMPTGAKKNEATGQWEQQYRAHVGVKGLRKIAREQANFTAKLAVMEPEEVQRYRRDMYHPDDIGVRCTLWRLDVARECKDSGIPYEPVIGVGFWRAKAQWHSGKKEWQADNIPNTWTAQQVAEKRAEINAIKPAYDLVLDVADPSSMDTDALDYVEYKVRAQEEDTAVHAPRQLQVEDDGDILYDVEAPPKQRVVEPSTGEITSPPAAPARSAPPSPTTPAADGTDNPFEVSDAYKEGYHDAQAELPTDEEHSIMENWATFGDAYEWAIANGCANKFEAKNSMDKIVKAHGGYSKDTRLAIMTAYIRRQREKVAQSDAVVEAAQAIRNA